MTEIYCVKCRTFTDTKSEKLVTTVNGRNRLAGICKECGSKKGMFVGKKRKFTRKTPEEIDEARSERIHRNLKKKALSIGWKVLNNEDAQKCVKQYITNKKK
jgi:hypothetical protein